MTALSYDAVQRVRARIMRAQQAAGARFRDAFAAGPLPPVAHMSILAAALLESAEGVRLNGEIAYDQTVDVVTPYVERGKPVYPYFEVARTPEAIRADEEVVRLVVGQRSRGAGLWRPA